MSVDGFGDFGERNVGRGRQITSTCAVAFISPIRLGLFYQAVTQFLGFWSYGDEYKVMGLAPYGEPTEMAAMRQIVPLLPDGGFELDLDYFRHHAEARDALGRRLARGRPALHRRLCELLGPPREAGAEILEHRTRTSPPRCRRCTRRPSFISGAARATGSAASAWPAAAAMNSVANGKVFERSPFGELYVQAPRAMPAARSAPRSSSGTSVRSAGRAAS